MPTHHSHRVIDAITAIGDGEIVIVTDPSDRENEGDLIMAAHAATEDTIAFFLEHTSGVICAGLPAVRCDELQLAPMVSQSTDPKHTAFTVSVDARHGTTTGISAADRATTLRDLADPSMGAHDFLRPGHMFPLRARDGGVLARSGHTEAAVDLTRLAGAPGGGALCEIVSADRRSMASDGELRRLAAAHGLPMISVAELIRHRLQTERVIDATHSARIPTRHGVFECHAWTSRIDGIEHLAFVRGEVTGDEPVLARIHSECLTGDVFGSARCDCGQQLDDALARIAQHGRGVLVYLRGHEGRGIGIGHKLAAYRLQDQGWDTVDANLKLGLPVDRREYGIGAQILRDLGVTTLVLMTNNPDKAAALSAYGLHVSERQPMRPHVTADNLRYLSAKRDRLGHDLPFDLAPRCDHVR